MDGVQLLRGYSHFEEAVYFLPLKTNVLKLPLLLLYILKCLWNYRQSKQAGPIYTYSGMETSYRVSSSIN